MTADDLAYREELYRKQYWNGVIDSGRRDELVEAARRELRDELRAKARSHDDLRLKMLREDLEHDRRRLAATIDGGRRRKHAALGLARKDFDCRIKSADAASGRCELYALTFGNLDRDGDVIEAGAVANVAEFIADGVALVGHKLDELPVGWIESAVQDSKGLRVACRFHSDPEAVRTATVVRERMAAGRSVKCSIGFKVLDASPRPGGRGLTIRRLAVYEVSFVNIPANELAGVFSA